MTGMSVFNGFGAGRIDCTELARLAAEKLPETPEQVFAWADALATRHAIGTIEVLTLLATGYSKGEVLRVAIDCDLGRPTPPLIDPVDWNPEEHRIYPEEGTP